MNLNTIGIICEYNPLHFGHLYHIKETKRLTGCENIVCIMSGSLVQRGEPAIFDKWDRARAAVDNGADLVIELPAYYVVQSAEEYAFGAVKILDRIGIVDGISFGSECGDIDFLKKCARITSCDENYKKILKRELENGIGYPHACRAALMKCLKSEDDGFFAPNNTLAICYISAIEKMNSHMMLFTVKRENDYHGFDSCDGYLSATAIRKMITDGVGINDYAPDYSGADTYNVKNAESYILGFLRNISACELENAKGYEDGLANRIINAARCSCTLEEFIKNSISKRYSIHRIKRCVLSAMLGVCEDLSPEYVRVLAFNQKGASLIKKIKTASDYDVITKTADAKRHPMLDIDIIATDFAALCCNNINKRIAGRDFLMSPYVKKQTRSL